MSQLVQVTEIDRNGKNATVRSTGGGSFKVPLTVRNGNGLPPQVGESWIVSRAYGMGWIFLAQIKDDPLPPVVSIDRNDPTSAVGKIFDALVSLGLLRDDDAVNSGADVAASRDVPQDPSPEGDDPVATSDEDLSEIIPCPLWIGTFNTDGAKRSNGAITKDLRRLLKTKVQVLGLQEMYNGTGDPGFRDPIASFLTSEGFRVLRKEGTDSEEWNWLVYREDDFILRDHGWQQLAPSSGSQIARWALWARLTHQDSGQRIAVVTTHLVPPTRYGDALYKTQVAAVASLASSLGSWGAVYVVGDFNVNYRSSGTYDASGYPGSNTFTSVPLTATYAHFAPPSNMGTHGLPVIDYIYQGPDVGELAYVQSTQIQRGYLSSHRPVLANISIKRKDTDVEGATPGAMGVPSS